MSTLGFTVVEIEGTSGRIDIQYKRYYTRKFLVTATQPIGPATARQALQTYQNVGIGAYYKTPLESDEFAWVTSIAEEMQNKDSYSYILTVEYGPFDPRIVENPLNRPLDISWDGEVYQEYYDVDVEGNNVVNSAGDPFDPPAQRDRSRSTMTIVRNEASFDQNTADALADCVNSDIFMGAQPGNAKVMPISAKCVFDPIAGLYWTVTYKFAFNKNGWQASILDAGLRQIDPSTQKLAQILVEGTPATTPVPLSNGVVLAQNAEPVYLSFSPYSPIDFATTFNFGF